MTRVIWKEEGEGEGPVFVFENDDEPGQPRPFNPDREPPQWVTLKEAEAVAEEHEVDLETS